MRGFVKRKWASGRFYHIKQVIQNEYELHATKFTLVVQNSSFLCRVEYCSIEKMEVESVNHLRCRMPLKGIFF